MTTDTTATLLNTHAHTLMQPMLQQLLLGVRISSSWHDEHAAPIIKAYTTMHNIVPCRLSLHVASSFMQHRLCIEPNHCSRFIAQIPIVWEQMQTCTIHMQQVLIMQSSTRHRTAPGLNHSHKVASFAQVLQRRAAVPTTGRHPIMHMAFCFGAVCVGRV
jgi:hypothetical protein